MVNAMFNAIFYLNYYFNRRYDVYSEENIATTVDPLGAYHLDLRSKYAPYDDFDNCYVGRDDLERKITRSILGAEKSGGSFLIGGYRGVGKTRLVKKVTESLRKKKKKIIWIDLGSDQKLSNRELLCDLLESIYQKQRIWERIVRKENKNKIAIWSVVIFAPLLYMLNIDFLASSHSYWVSKVIVDIACAVSIPPIIALLFLNALIKLNPYKHFSEVDELIRKTRYTENSKKEVNFTFGRMFGLGGSNNLQREPISTRRLHQELCVLLNAY